MLVVALAATLIGFALLVLALITGVVWLAFTCIAVCAVGILFLVADTMGVRVPHLPRRRRGSPRSADDRADTSGEDRPPIDSLVRPEDAPTTEIPRLVDPLPSLDTGPVAPGPGPDPVSESVAEPEDGHGRHERSESTDDGPAPHASRHRRPD